MANELFVRLKPYAPRRGYKAQRYSYKGQVYVGGARPNWYQVSKELAEDLLQHRQDHADPDSKPLFDLMDGEKKQQVEEQEQANFLAGLGYGAATVAPPTDLKQPMTTDIRTADEKAAAVPPSMPAPNVGGRAAAVPKVRVKNKKNPKTAAIVSDDAGSNKGADGEGEG